MDIKAVLSRKDFWKSVFWLGISFLFIYNLIAILFEYGGFDFRAFYSDKIADGKWIRFLVANLLGAFLYGFILAFGQFHLNEKKK